MPTFQTLTIPVRIRRNPSLTLFMYSVSTLLHYLIRGGFKMRSIPQSILRSFAGGFTLLAIAFLFQGIGAGEAQATVKRNAHGKHAQKSRDLATTGARFSNWDDFLNRKSALNSQIKRLEAKGIRLADNGVDVSDEGSDLSAHFDSMKTELVSEIQSILTGISAYVAQYGNFPYRMTLTKNGKAYLLSKDSPNLLYTDVTNELGLMKKKASVLEKWARQIRESTEISQK